MSTITDANKEVAKKITTLRRKNPVNIKNRFEYISLAHTLEVQAQDLRRRAAVVNQ